MKFSIVFFLTVTMMTASIPNLFAQTATIDTLKAGDDITITTIKTKVKGITCATDLTMISANVEKLEGVATCKAGKTGPTTTFEIAYNPSLVTEQKIYAAIENTGSCENPDERPYKIKQ